VTEVPLSAFIEADVHLLAPADGGRRSAIASGYRCNCLLDERDRADGTSYDATFLLLDTDRLEPGDTARARIQPHFPDPWTGVEIGTVVEMCEGPRTVGRATVVDLFPDRISFST
jgi:elongation factor Tu